MIVQPQVVNYSLNILSEFSAVGVGMGFGLVLCAALAIKSRDPHLLPPLRGIPAPCRCFLKDFLLSSFPLKLLLLHLGAFPLLRTLSRFKKIIDFFTKSGHRHGAACNPSTHCAGKGRRRWGKCGLNCKILFQKKKNQVNGRNRRISC